MRFWRDWASRLQRLPNRTMRVADAPASYSSAQKWLHWVITAIIVLVMIPAGLTMTRIGNGALKNSLYELHKSFGITVFALAAIRIVVRWRRGAPPVEPEVPAWQRTAAYVSHYALYVLMILVPLTGWAATSACCAPVNLFWTVPLTLPVPGDEDLAKTIFRLHYTFVYALAGVILAHVGGSLQHHLIRRDRTLLRMLPESSRRAAM